MLKGVTRAKRSVFRLECHLTALRVTPSSGVLTPVSQSGRVKVSAPIGLGWQFARRKGSAPRQFSLAEWMAQRKVQTL